jgi:hypothetical protein
MRSRSVKNQLDEIFDAVTDVHVANNTNIDNCSSAEHGHEGKETSKESREGLPRSHSLGRDRDREEAHSHSRPASLRIEIEEAPKNERERKRENRRSRITIENSPSQYSIDKLISSSPANSTGVTLPEKDPEKEKKEVKERTRSPSKSRSSSRSESTSGEDEKEGQGIVRSQSEAVKNMKRIKGHRKVKSSGASHDIQNIISQTI